MAEIKAYLRLLRPHQWTKNCICLAPIPLSGRWSDLPIWLLALHGAALFCLVSSLAYIINDLLDIRTDRSHPDKKHRPLASGAVSPQGAMTLAALLILAVTVLSIGISSAALLWLTAYLAAALAYSCWLKRLLAMDVVLLSLFYVVRLMFGGAVTHIVISVWTLVFAVFMFLSLALIKRISEVHLMGVMENGAMQSRRPYRQGDKPVLVAQACASAYTSLLVFALYLNSPEASSSHARPQVLWLLLPLLTYWLSRLLIISHRGEMHHDPVIFSLRDKTSWAVLVMALSILLVAF